MKIYRFLYALIGLFISLSSEAQFGVQGSAVALSTDCFQLTLDSLGTDGKIVSNRVLDLTNPVTLYTEIFFGNNDDGGDGIAFFMQTENQFNTSTNPSFGLGMNQSSLAIEFDTYQNVDPNLSLNDPNFDHIAIIRDGDFNHSSVNNLQGPVNASSSGNIEDGTWHSVKVDWQPETNTLSVLFDCEERINYQIDLINEIFGGNPEVFYGFSASTHQAQNQQEICVVLNTLINRLEDVVLCQGGKTQLNTVRGGVRYNWTPSEGLNFTNTANPVATPSADVTYSLAIETGFCDEFLNYEFTIEVIDTPGPREFITEDTTLCQDEPFEIDATLENGTDYGWSTGLRQPIESFTRNGRYDVTVTIGDVCIVEDWARLTFNDGPSVALGNDTTICQRTNGFVLKPVVDLDELEFLWNNGSTADSLFVTREGLYTVQVSTTCGSDEANIFVNTEDCRNFYMPNAFTPNSDGINDTIFPFTENGDISQITSYKIYNRWGVQVHSIENGTPNSPEIAWDGTYRNEPEVPGIYVYEIILQFRDGQESLIKGDFTLIK